MLPPSVYDTFTQASLSYTQFNLRMHNAFAHFFRIYSNTVLEYGRSWSNVYEMEKVLRSRVRETLDEEFRKRDFIDSLSDVITDYSELAKTTGLGKVYQYTSNRSSVWNNEFLEPIRDTLNRTTSEKLCEIEKYSLFHYKRPLFNGQVSATDVISEREGSPRTTTTTQGNTPILVIYAFINRHYILDLLPEVSVIRSLLNNKLDIFATDWGTPSAYDKSLTIGHFVNKYLDKSIDFIRNMTKSEKVTLFGYCWGGDLAIIYAALHPEKVRNLVTVATPGDFELDNSLLAVWTKAMKENYILDTFGNLPGTMLNAAFILRNPIEYSHKYFHFFEKPRSLESVIEFFATETWLYDSPPIIGEIYREFVERCYKQNLLIKSKMTVELDSNSGSGAIVDLKNIKMPFLNIVANRDDLVAPSSSKALNDAFTESNDRKLIEHNSGHVGLMIGKRAHKELWPEVGEWIRKRS
ncbi:MAG TPA: alpha/beta fold hydrolase [Nitrososphaeraceae archaeon]|nr:alpha/beta fold hydrolase [Nitrososphaeraceae archaeon]